MKRIILALLLAASAAHASWEDHWLARAPTIAAHQLLAGQESAMVLGDSISEQFWWNVVGGCRIVNGGFAAITTKELHNRMNQIVPGSPRYAWLMIGTNTANHARSGEVAQYWGNLQGIVQNLINRGTRPILVSIPPVDKFKPVAVASFSQASINYMNSQASQLAAQYGLYFVNLNYDMMDLNPSSQTYGYAIPSMTQADGVHLSRAANIILFQHYTAAINHQQSWTGVPCWN